MRILVLSATPDGCMCGMVSSNAPSALNALHAINQFPRTSVRHSYAFLITWKVWNSCPRLFKCFSRSHLSAALFTFLLHLVIYHTVPHAVTAPACSKMARRMLPLDQFHTVQKRARQHETAHVPEYADHYPIPNTSTFHQHLPLRKTFLFARTSKYQES